MSKLFFLDISLDVTLKFCSVDSLFVANLILTEIWDVAEGPVVMCIFDLKQGLPLVFSEILDRTLFILLKNLWYSGEGRK